MNLSAPTMVVFTLSLIIALVGLLSGFAIIPTLPVTAFLIMTIAYAVLAVACIFKGV